MGFNDSGGLKNPSPHSLLPNRHRAVPLLSAEINGTQICPTSLVSIQDFSPSDLDSVPRLRYLRLDGNLLKPPIPLDLMLCFRLLQSVVF